MLDLYRSPPIEETIPAFKNFQSFIIISFYYLTVLGLVAARAFLQLRPAGATL